MGFEIEQIGNNPIQLASNRMESILPEEVKNNEEAVGWLGMQAASMINIIDCKGAGIDGAFGRDVANWMNGYLDKFTKMKIGKLSEDKLAEQIADSLRSFLDADFSTNLRPVGYDEHKDLLPYLVKIVLAGKLK